MTAVADANRRFARNLRLLRRAQEITGTELARRTGLPEQAVYRIESGARGSSPRVATIGEATVLAAALGVDLAHMVAETVTRVPVGAVR